MNLYKTVESYLREYKWYKLFVEDNKKLLTEIKNDYQGTKAITYDHLPCYTSDFFSVVENETLSREETITRLENKIKETEEVVVKVEKGMSKLNEIDKKIIELYYIDYQPWYAVAYKVSLSERQCRTRRTNAIKRMINYFRGLE